MLHKTSYQFIVRLFFKHALPYYSIQQNPLISCECWVIQLKKKNTVCLLSNKQLIAANIYLFLRETTLAIMIDLLSLIFLDLKQCCPYP